MATEREPFTIWILKTIRDSHYSTKQEIAIAERALELLECSKPMARNVCSDQLWQDILEFIEAQEDVKDGTDGPRPNDAMSLMTRIRQDGR